MIKKSRSDKYQAYYLEVSIDPFIIDSYSIYKGFDINIDSGDGEDGYEKILYKFIFSLVDKYLTETQKTCIRGLFIDGKTQVEIGKELGIKQSTVAHYVFGRVRTNKEGEKRRTGGAIELIRELIRNNNEELQELIKDYEIKTW